MVFAKPSIFREMTEKAKTIQYISTAHVLSVPAKTAKATVIDKRVKFMILIVGSLECFMAQWKLEKETRYKAR